MWEAWMVILTTVLLAWVGAAPEIGAVCGQVVVQGYKYCEISHNDEIFPYEGPIKQVFSQLRFGLVTYRCDHEAGFFLSRIDCENCDLECSEVEFTRQVVCEADPTQFWAGFILGLFVSLLIGSIVLRRLWRALDPLGTNSDGTPRHSVSTIGRIEEVSIKGSEEDGSGSGSASGSRTQDSPTSDDKDPRTKRPATKTAHKKSFASAIAGLFLFGSTDACNVIVTMDSGNVTMFCQDTVCAAQPSPFKVTKGFEICIEDHFGARVSLHVSDIVWRARYELAYYTTDYTVSVVTESKCCSGSSESDCWAPTGNCLARASKKLVNRQTLDTALDYQCLWANQNKLYVNCAYLTKSERMGDLYEVLRKTTEVGEIKFYVKEGYFSREMTLSEYNPSYWLNLTRFKMQNVDTIPITVLDSSSNKNPSQSLLRYGDKVFFVNSSAPLDPQPDRFGDFQVALNRLDETAAKPVVVCETQAGGCSCKCEYTRNSTIRSFLDRRWEFEQPKNYIVRKADVSIVETFEPHDSGDVLVTLGNWGGSYGQKRGKCDVAYFGSHACSTCSDRGSIVFKAFDIEKVGLIPFHSNCSFDRYTIGCDFEPTKLVLRNHSGACYFRLPTLNKQFNVSIKYYKFGHVRPERQANCKKVYMSVGDALEHLVTSGLFIETFFGTVCVSLVLCVFLPIVLRILHKRRRNSSFAVTNTDDLLDL